MVALLAWRARALKIGGALAAFAVGACVFGSGAWPYAAVLFAFFIPSTLLSRAGRAVKRRLIDTGKHGARDQWQVLANGGVAAACALATAAGHSPALAAAFAGAFAAAAADTFGTEIGTLVRATPRSILTLRPVARGLSGGITFAGTTAEIAGALFVAAVAWVCGVSLLIPVAIGGIAGALVDSLLGATAQELRYCTACLRECETDPHACGTATTRIRGIGWMNNDAVNAAATLSGALIAGLLYTVFQKP